MEGNDKKQAKKAIIWRGTENNRKTVAETAAAMGYSTFSPSVSRGQALIDSNSLPNGTVLDLGTDAFINSDGTVNLDKVRTALGMDKPAEEYVPQDEIVPKRKKKVTEKATK